MIIENIIETNYYLIHKAKSDYYVSVSKVETIHFTVKGNYIEENSYEVQEIFKIYRECGQGGSLIKDYEGKSIGEIMETLKRDNVVMIDETSLLEKCGV